MFKKGIYEQGDGMRNYREFVTETVKNPEEAAEYLRASLEEYSSDGNLEDLQGGITELAKKTELNRQTLYRTLSKEGNPRIKTLRSVLSSLGFRLSVDPAESFQSRQRLVPGIHQYSEGL
jgi:probable addiction module antidote protein